MHRAVITRLVKSIISRPHHRPACRRKSTRTLTAPKARLLNRTTLRTPRMGRNTSRNTPHSLRLRKRRKASRHSHHLRRRITTSIHSAPRLLRIKTLHRSSLMHPTAKARVRAAGKRRPTKRKTKATLSLQAHSMNGRNVARLIALASEEHRTTIVTCQRSCRTEKPRNRRRANCRESESMD